MPRRYQHTQKLLKEIKEMLDEGMSQREVEKELGLEGYRPVHTLLQRERRKEKRLAAGITPHPKGRPRKDATRDVVAEQAYEIQRLKMENELLRDFLRLAGRRPGQG